jgi:hypothetical protein
MRARSQSGKSTYLLNLLKSWSNLFNAAPPSAILYVGHVIERDFARALASVAQKMSVKLDMLGGGLANARFLRAWRRLGARLNHQRRSDNAASSASSDPNNATTTMIYSTDEEGDTTPPATSCEETETETAVEGEEVVDDPEEGSSGSSSGREGRKRRRRPEGGPLLTAGGDDEDRLDGLGGRAGKKMARHASRWGSALFDNRNDDLSRSSRRLSHSSRRRLVGGDTTRPPTPWEEEGSGSGSAGGRPSFREDGTTFWLRPTGWPEERSVAKIPEPAGDTCP